MKNIPTKEDLIGYIKGDKKTIGWTIGIFILLFMLLISYSIYSTFTEAREEEDQFLTQEEMVEILEREPEEVTAGDVRNIEEALEQERYAFGILIEREDQTFFNYPDLITEFLISEEVVSYVEESIGEPILPSPELAVEVSQDSSTRIQEIIIGTGDVEDNQAIAAAYYEAIQQEGLISPLDDKIIYMMDNEPFLVEEETWMDLVLVQIQYVSPARAVIGLIVFTILGFVAGTVIVLLKTLFKKEIPFMYELKEKESDTVLYFTQIRNDDEDDRHHKLAHAILTYPERKKLVLSEGEINIELRESLSLKNHNTELIHIADDVSNRPINMQPDEVVILVEKNKTTKSWYNNQRIQLERIDAPVTILTY